MTEDGGSNTSSCNLNNLNGKAVTAQKGASSAVVTGDEDDEPNIGGICGSHNSNQFHPGWRFYSAISVFMVLTLLESANSTSTSTALVALGVVIPNSTSAQLEWIGNSYMLTAAVFQLPIASLSSIFGRKPLVLISFALFIIGAGIAGSAHNMAALLSGRTIQGIGGAGTLVLSEVCIADMVPLRFRARYYALLSVMWAIGSGVGPLMGGGLTRDPQNSSNSWRWIFYLNVPIAGVALLVTVFVLESQKRPSADDGSSSRGPRASSRRDSQILSIRRIDLLGTFLIIAASTSFILGLTLGGVTFSWNSWHVLVPLLLGFCGIVGFIIYEIWGTATPMLAVNVLFSNRSAGIAYFHALIQGFMMEALPYYLPLFYQGVLLYSPLISGLALLPFSTIILPSSILSGLAVSRYGKYKWVSAAGWAVLTTGLGLLLIPSSHNKSIGAWLGPIFPVSVGLGTLYSALGTAVQAPQAPPQWADAAAMMSFVRSVGEAMGVAVGGAIFASQMATQTSGLPLPPSIDPKESFVLVNYINELSDDDPTKALLQDSLSNSMHTVYYLYLGLAAFCLILNMFLKEYSLDQGNLEYMSREESYKHIRKFSRSSATSDSSMEPAAPAKAIIIQV